MTKNELKTIRDYIRKLKYKARRSHKPVPDVRIAAWREKDHSVEVKFNDDVKSFTTYGTEKELNFVLDAVGFYFYNALLDTMHEQVNRIR